MNLTDKLMQVDKDVVRGAKTAEVKLKNLSNRLGEEVTVKVTSLPPKRIMELSTDSVDDDGDVDMLKGYDATLHIACEAVIDLDLTDKALQSHFGAETPKDLAEILFVGNDLAHIANTVREISGLGDDKDAEDEKKKKKIKNS